MFHVEQYAIMHDNHPQIEHNVEGIFSGLPEAAQARLRFEAERRVVPLSTVLQEALLKVAASIKKGCGPASEAVKFPHFLFGLDVETGGFEPGKHALLAIGCWWRAGNGATRGLRVRVQRQEGTVVEPGASEVNGWKSDQQWEDAGAVSLKMAVWQLLEFLERLKLTARVQRVVPVAHNALFDRSFIQWALLNCGAPDYAVTRWENQVSHLWRCSMQTMLGAMDAGVIPKSSAALDRLIGLSGQPERPRGHDPEGDARAALIGYEWLLAKLGGRAGLRLSEAA